MEAESSHSLEKEQQLGKLIKFVSRNLRLVLICWLLGLAGGLVWYLRSPKVYQASALIMYQQQQVNPTRMSPDVQTRFLEMVNTVSQQVTSRSNLEELIKINNLYPGMRQSLPMEDVVSYMRSEHITIQPKMGADVFAVAFEGADPHQVMRVTNGLASKFIEENIRFREQRVTETMTYVKDELSMAKATLDRQEQAMRDFKLQHYNEMPEQRPVNIARLDSLQSQYQNIQNNLQDLKKTRLLIQEQINLREDILTRLATVAGDISPVNTTSELARVRQELEELQSRYTDSHPDVRRLRNRLAILREALEDGENNKQGARSKSGQRGDRPRDPQLAQLELQLKEIDFSAERLNQNQQTILTQIARIQVWIEATPNREAEWASLTRDYSQLQQHYQSLVARNIEAESAELLERRQKGSQFRIIEPAHLPGKPSKPDFRRFIIFATAIGIGLGTVLAFALESMNTSFKDVNEIESYLGLPVTCAIPTLQTTREKKKLLLYNIAWSLGLGSGFAVMIGGMLLLWQNGMIIL
jgi:polysaccharide biosynthesis transport protein